MICKKVEGQVLFLFFFDISGHSRDIIEAPPFIIMSPRREIDRVPLLPRPAQSSTHTDEPPPSFESHVEFGQPKPQSPPQTQNHFSELSPRPQPVAAFPDFDAQSLLPPYSEANKYGCYKSEAEYLSALRAWAESKQYIDTNPTVGGGLIGFYGHRTMEEERARIREEKRVKKEEREKRMEEKMRMKRELQVSRLESVPSRRGHEQGGQDGEDGPEDRRRWKAGISRKWGNVVERMVNGGVSNDRRASAR